MSVTQKIKDGFSQLSLFEKIIAFNVFIFIVYRLLSLPGSPNTYKHFFDYFALPSTLGSFIKQPWSILSYAFLHYDFLHILFNMLWLFVIGRFFANVFNYKEGLKIFILGILTGGILFLIAYALLPGEILKTTQLVGASAGIRALLIFLCAYMPQMDVRVFTFRLKLWHIGAFVIAMDTIGLFSTNVGGNIAHFGGNLLGYFYATKLSNTSFSAKLDSTFNSIENLFKVGKKGNLKTVHKRSKKVAGYTKNEFKEFNTQKRVDLILDKISKSGYESLTKEEKEFLFKAGK